MRLLEKLRQSRMVKSLVLFTAVNLTVFEPIKLGIIAAGSVSARSYLSGLSLAGIGLGAYSNKLYASDLNEELRNWARNAGGQVKSGATEGMQEAELGNLFGSDDDRAYNDSHTLSDGEKWDDNTTRSRGIFYESQISGDKDSSEGKVYDFLKGMSRQEQYHTRDRDHKAFGDILTLQNPDGPYAEKYRSISDSLQDGIMCTDAVVTPAVYEDRIIENIESCEVNNGESWAAGSCEIRRELIVPALEGSGFTKTHGGHSISYSGRGRQAYQFQIENLDMFNDTFSINYDTGSVNEKSGLEVTVNGIILVFNHADAQGVINIPKSNLLEGSNTVSVLLHPEGFNLGVTKKEIINPKTNSSDFPYSINEETGILRLGQTGENYWTGGNNISFLASTYDRRFEFELSESTKNRLSAFVMQSIHFDDYMQVSINGELIYNSLGGDVLETGSISCRITSGSNSGAYRTAAFVRSKSGAIASCRPGGITIRATGDGVHVGDPGNGNATLNRNIADLLVAGLNTIDVRTVVVDRGEVSINFRAISRSEPMAFSLQLFASAFRENVADYPVGCVNGANQFFTRADGINIYGLPGKAFPVTSSWPVDGVSNDTWECTDRASTRKLGNLASSVASSAEIGSLVRQLFPNIVGVSSSICYKAKARNYGVDITTAPICADGTFNCYLSSRSKRVMDFLASFMPINAAYAQSSVGDFLTSMPQCNALEEKSNCAQISQSCEYRDPVTGECSRYLRHYSCATTERVVVTPEVTTRTCTASIPCMAEDSEECRFEAEQSTSFTNAAIALSITTFAENDRECFADSMESCTLFRGEDRRCRSRVTGLGHETCCSDPSGVNPTDYIETLFAAYQFEYVNDLVNSAASSVYSAGADLVTGTWEALAGNSNSYAATQAGNFTSATGSVVQQGGESLGTPLGAQSGAIGTTINFAGDAVASFFKDALGDTIGDMLFDNVIRNETGNIVGRYAADGAIEAVGNVAQEDVAKGVANGTLIDGVGLGQLVGNILGGVMLAYQIYSIAKLVHALLTACDEDEYETSYKRATGSCHEVSDQCTSENLIGCVERTKTFCCYSSPLARIIHEQAFISNQHPFTGGWSAYQQAGCRGFTFAEFAQIDFDQLDLNEWVSLLIGADKLPSPTNYEQFFSEENVANSVSESMKADADLPSERANALVSAMDDAEEVRLKQRENLIIDDQYGSYWRDCGYDHDMAAGVSKQTQERVGTFADGIVRIVESCQVRSDSRSFAHQKEQCQNGGVTTWFTGFMGERVVLSACVVAP